MSGYDHAEYAYELFALFEWNNELPNAEAVLVMSLEREEVRRSLYFGWLLYALARVRRLSGDNPGALEVLERLRGILPRPEEDARRERLSEFVTLCRSLFDIDVQIVRDHDARNRALADYEAMCRAILQLDLGLVPAARRSLSRHSSFQQGAMRAAHVVSTEAFIELERGRTDAAIGILREALGRPELEDRTRTSLRALLGNALIKAGQYEAGLEQIDESLCAGGLYGADEAYARRVGALAHIELGNLKAAEDMLSPLELFVQSPLHAADYAAARWRIADLAGSDAEELSSRLIEVRETYKEFLRVWRETPLIEGGVGFFVPKRRRLLMEQVIRAELSQPDRNEPGERAEVAFQQVLDAQRCGQLARRLGGHRLTVQELRTWLAKEGGGVLVFLPVADSTLLFVVDEMGATIERCPSREALRKIVRAAERDREDRSLTVQEFTEILDEFSSAALPHRVRVAIEKWETIRFDGLDLITDVPPSMLRTLEGRWLGCESPVVVWPSCAVAHQLVLRSRSQPGRSGLLGLLNPDSVPSRNGDEVPNLPQLSFESHELRSLEELASPALPIRTQSRSEATLESVAQNALRWLWIHAHGVVDHSRERAAGLVLAASNENRVSIWPPKIEERFPEAQGPDLVFLGACRAGEGNRRLGDDEGNPLGAAFMLAGAESVVLATTDLRHAPTKQLSLLFWTHVFAGTSPAEALRLARVTLRDAGKDPREYAALNLIGLN